MSLIIKQLNKTYANGVKALDNVSLEVGNGMFGLLGPNGAGKSTLMRMLATLQMADSGAMRLADIDMIREPLRVKQRLGYLPQEFGVYPGISAVDLLTHFAILKGITDKGERREVVKYLLQQVNLYEARNRHVFSYSGGMRQRFGIAQALLGSPALIVADEPTAGLDPDERLRVNNLLCRFGENAIVILSTHLVDDVRDLCSSMAVMNKGRIVLCGRTSELMSRVKGKIWRRAVPHYERAHVDQMYQVLYSGVFEGMPYVRIYSEDDPGNGFEPVTPGLEDIYFRSLSESTD